MTSGYGGTNDLCNSITLVHQATSFPLTTHALPPFQLTQPTARSRLPHHPNIINPNPQNQSKIVNGTRGRCHAFWNAFDNCLSNITDLKECEFLRDNYIEVSDLMAESTTNLN